METCAWPAPSPVRDGQPGHAVAQPIAVSSTAADTYPWEGLRTTKETVLVAYASETGFIDDMAQITQRDLATAGIAVRLVELGDLDAGELERATTVLFMTSTTGAGDPPFVAEPFSMDVMSALARLPHLRFGLLCAGDSSYETFCEFGHRLGDWLLASGARPLFEPIDVDCEDERAIKQWRRCVTRAFSIARSRPAQ